MAATQGRPLSTISATRDGRQHLLRADGSHRGREAVRKTIKAGPVIVGRVTPGDSANDIARESAREFKGEGPRFAPTTSYRRSHGVPNEAAGQQ
jgi:hypothetical protein